MQDSYAREHEMRRLRTELDRLWADLKVVKEQMWTMGRREGEALSAQAGPQLDRLKAEAERLIARVRAQTGDLERQARARPGLTLLAAAGLFLLALRLVKRR